MKHLFSQFVALFISVASWSAVTQEDFSKINLFLVNFHAPIVLEKHNAQIRLKELYDNYGGAFRVDSAHKPIGENTYVVTLTGELPHSGVLNADGYALVACHEIGHILGGEPRQTKKITEWSSVEGQADYHATNVCMWQYVVNDPTDQVIHRFDASVIRRCEDRFFPDTKKGFQCIRIMSGIQSLVDYFNALPTTARPISISQRDDSVVKKTLEKYPSAQCRVDTWIAGLFDEEKPRCWHAN